MPYLQYGTFHITASAQYISIRLVFGLNESLRNKTAIAVAHDYKRESEFFFERLYDRNTVFHGQPPYIAFAIA